MNNDVLPEFLRIWLLDSGAHREFDDFRGLNLDAPLDKYWFRRITQAPAILRICAIYSGIPLRIFLEVSRRMNVSIVRLASDLRLVHEVNGDQCEILSCGDAERILRVCCLIGGVDIIVEESGLVKNFDAFAWLSKWLYSPLPALAGGLPAELLGCSEGVDYLRQQVESMQSSAFL